VIKSIPLSSQHIVGNEFQAVDDLDGDGKQDILVPGYSIVNGVADELVALGSVSGTTLYRVRPLPNELQKNHFPWALANLGDVDGDDRSEWVLSHLTATAPVTQGRGVVRVMSYRPLYASPKQSAAPTGPQVRLDLNGSVPNAGGLYLVVASASGTAGIAFQGLTVPITYDGLTAATIVLANTGIFSNTLSTLDATTGSATAWFDPKYLPPAANGLTFWFAYVGLGPPGYFTSNAEPVVLSPAGS
jgi:hypothetical protein